MYSCPMHPEVTSPVPGRCTKCGMALVLTRSNAAPRWRRYRPLLVVIGLILLTAAALAWRDLQENAFSWSATLSYFMVGFFLVFAGFKLMDLPGFASGYATYDLLAARLPAYGYLYPFIELFFALAMLLNMWPRSVLWAEIIVMGFSGLGVARKLWKREQFECACLGTFLKVPLTYVTLIEDFGMAALAALVLLLTA